MHILYVSANYESVQIHLCEALNKQGMVADIFCYTLSKKTFDYPPEVYHYTLPIKCRGPILYLTRLNLVAKKCLKIVDAIRPDVLHGNMTFCDGYICRYIFRKTGIPYVLSFRNTDLNHKFLWKIPWIFKAGIQTIRLSKKIIFLSPQYMSRFLDRLSERINGVENKCTVIPNGIDDYFLLNRKSKERINNELKIIFVGRVNKLKNIECTIEAAKLLIKQGYVIEYRIVGDIEDLEYRKIIENNKFINYYPRCSKEEVLKHLRECDIFVMPSHTESFGLVYAEAMSQGLPIIYTRGQGFDGHFCEGEVGYSVNDNDPEEIKQRILQIYDRYNEISANCEGRSLEFSWGKITERLAQVYLTAINDPI